MVFSVNNSPFSGRDGKLRHLAQAARAARARGADATSRSASSPPTRPDAFEVAGRGELQLAILIETMRREGYELGVGKPEVITKTIDGVLHEPMELLIIDVPEELHRRGDPEARPAPRPHDEDDPPRRSGRVRLEFRIPSRGLIGFRSRVPRPTPAAPASLHHALRRLGALAGRHPAPHHRRAGRRPRRQGHRLRDRAPAAARRSVLPADRRGLRGHVVGEHSRADDLDVNITREKKLTNMRASTPRSSSAQLDPQDEPRAGARVHRRRRARRGDAELPSGCASASCAPTSDTLQPANTRQEPLLNRKVPRRALRRHPPNGCTRY